MNAHQSLNATLEDSIVVKVGTEVITRGNKLDKRIMQNIAQEVDQLTQVGTEVILVSSGAVGSALGKVPEEHREENRTKFRQGLATLGQPDLIYNWRQRFEIYDIDCAQILADLPELQDEARVRSLLKTLDDLYHLQSVIGNRIIAVVNGDDSRDRTEYDRDNDKIGGGFARILKAKAYVILTSVDGLYTGNPEDPSSTLIREVDTKVHHNATFEGKSKNGTGGMKTKAEELIELASMGVDGYIANGKKPGVIQAALNKQEGTWFHS